MSLIDDIERDLKEISPWPWKAVDGEVATAVGLKWDTTFDIEDLIFVIKAPERIADLVEYVRAAEALYFPDKANSAVAETVKRLHAARAKLGLK